MDSVITSISGLTSAFNVADVDKKSPANSATGETSFDAIMKAAMDLVNEANDLNSAAEYEELRVSLGYAENTHDLTAALEKAELAVQYTVAIKNKVLEAYKEIMNMQV